MYQLSSIKRKKKKKPNKTIKDRRERESGDDKNGP